QLDVRRVAAGLRLQLASLLDAEPVLLIDHDDAETGELDPLLDQRVGSDDDWRPARLDEVADMARDGRALRSGQELDGDPGAFEKVSQRRVMLAGEEVRRG